MLLNIIFWAVLLLNGIKGQDDEFFVIQPRSPSFLASDEYQASTETPVLRDEVIVTKVRLHGGKAVERVPSFSKVFENFRQANGGYSIPTKVFREMFTKTWGSPFRRDLDDYSKKPLDNHYLRARRNYNSAQGAGTRGGRVAKESRDSSRNHFWRANRSNQANANTNVGDRKARNHYLRSV